HRPAAARLDVLGDRRVRRLPRGRAPDRGRRRGLLVADAGGGGCLLRRRRRPAQGHRLRLHLRLCGALRRPSGAAGARRRGAGAPGGRGPLTCIVFGVIRAFVARYVGHAAPPTPEGVARAATTTVVASSLAVLAADFVLTALMFST